MQRTDTRALAERRHSVTLRIDEIRKALRAAEECAAEIDRALAQKANDNVAAE